MSHGLYGFRSKHSTQHAVLDIVNTILQNMDNGKFSCGVFIDLKKAFDTVNHEILLAKLENYGIRGVINSWFRSYLTDRKQTTEVNNVVSEAETTLRGVPQGSVLGPLLFLLCINDIREIKIHVYDIRQTASVSWEFLRIENKKLKTVQNDSFG